MEVIIFVHVRVMTDSWSSSPPAWSRPPGSGGLRFDRRRYRTVWIC